MNSKRLMEGHDIIRMRQLAGLSDKRPELPDTPDFSYEDNEKNEPFFDDLKNVCMELDALILKRLGHHKGQEGDGELDRFRRTMRAHFENYITDYYIGRPYDDDEPWD